MKKNTMVLNIKKKDDLDLITKYNMHIKRGQ